MTPGTAETAPRETTHNVAESGAMVGVQGRVVHNVNVYQMPPDATPRQKYEIGLRFLNDGVPFKAVDLIEQAMAAGLENAEIRFHWVLAMFSKRSYRDLNRLERDRLDELAERLRAYPEGEHRRALEAISELIAHFSGEGGSVETAEKRILELEPDLLTSIQRHLQTVLSGATKDKLWAEARKRAQEERTAHGRLDRVWAYFHPEPIPARTLPPEENQTDPLDGPYATAATALSALAAGYLGWLLLSAGELTALLAYAAALAAGWFGARDAFEWRYRADRLTLEERRHFPQFAPSRPRGTGFAREVSHAFDHYFARYRPSGSDYSLWLAETAGIRAHLRAEILELYREKRVTADRVRWLIAYLAKDVRRRKTAGTLYEYRERYRVPFAMRVRCALALTLALVAAFDVLVTAVPLAPLTATGALLMAVCSGVYATRQWYRIRSEERRYEEETADFEQRKSERHDAYLSWKGKLDSIRPSESEMETWLDCDKTILIDEALRLHRLSWSDVIAYALLQGHGGRAKAGRAKGGPWRYSRYELRLFLITKDGVREVSSGLDFARAAFSGRERDNYRFDALSSVHVSERNEERHVLELTLTNGPTRNINVTDTASMASLLETVQSDEVDFPEDLPQMNLSAAGFEHALRILEGIAAEGKGWIERDRRPPLP